MGKLLSEALNPTLSEALSIDSHRSRMLHEVENDSSNPAG